MKIEIDRIGNRVNLIIIPEFDTDYKLLEEAREPIMVAKEVDADVGTYLVLELK